MDENIINALDLVGYDTIINFIETHKLYNLPGDILEVGSFLGGGTVKLGKMAKKYNKKVYTIDVFSPDFDTTVNLQGLSMAQIYSLILQGKSQRDIFNKVIEGYENIHVIPEDSKKVIFPSEQNFFFTFIDGNHSKDYVWSDFILAWNNTLPSGVIGFHDYGGDLPETTMAIDNIINEYEKDIEKIEQVKEKWILFIFKKGCSETGCSE